MIEKREGKRGASYRVQVWGKPSRRGAKRPYLSGTTKTYRDAKRMERNFEAQIEAGINPDRDTLSAYLDRWQASRNPRVAATTWKRQGQLIKKVQSARIAKMKLRDLLPDDFDIFYADLLESGRQDGAGGLSSRTVLHIHRMLHKALRDAEKRKLIASNPASLADPPKVTKTEFELPGDNALAAALEALRKNRLWPSILIMFATGLRRGEALALRWSDLDVERNKLTIQRALVRVDRETLIKEPKTRSSVRVVTIPESVTRELLAWQKDQRVEAVRRGYRNPDNWIMTNIKGEPMNPNTFTTMVIETSERAGVRLSPHKLRHLHATELLRAGVHAKIAQTRLGHSTVGTTLDIYSHVLDEMNDEATEVASSVMERIGNLSTNGS